MTSPTDPSKKSMHLRGRANVLDWLKGWAIIAVILDHAKIFPEPVVVWSVNIFVLVTAAVYSKPGYVFSKQKLGLKILHLFYFTSAALLLIKALNVFARLPNPESLLSVFLNPYSFWVHNSYLTDIWYIALHLQIIVLLFFCLKSGVLLKQRQVWICAGIITFLSYFITHLMLKHFHTISITSWLIFLTAGFYGMRPFMNTIATYPHNRWLVLFSALALLLLFYSWYPVFPWAFTNQNRALYLTLPFYFALILFFSELFYILDNSRSGKWVHLLNILGRYTLAIYLTHRGFQRVWDIFIPLPLLSAALAMGSGILFGMAADRLFAPIRSFVSAFLANLRLKTSPSMSQIPELQEQKEDQSS